MLLIMSMADERVVGIAVIERSRGGEAGPEERVAGPRTQTSTRSLRNHILGPTSRQASKRGGLAERFV